ncbi:hypothetical protein EUTSA_v10027056mg, partial [Eutrema salsugineum]
METLEKVARGHNRCLPFKLLVCSLVICLLLIFSNTSNIICKIIKFYEEFLKVKELLFFLKLYKPLTNCLKIYRDNEADVSNELINYAPSNNFFLHSVKLLDCENILMTCLPSNFNTDFLFELNMPNSKLEKLWDGVKTIRNLKWMDLSHSENLKELPDLSTATNLCELKLLICSSLVKLPSSIGNATKLLKLDLTGCSSLVEFPSSIGNLINLQFLDLKGCSKLEAIPSSIGNVIKLLILDLTGCSSLVELPSSIGNLINLKDLDLRGCSSLVKLPSSIENLHNLSYLPLKGCSKLEALPININMESLDTLDLTDYSSLKNFPEISTKIKSLFICGTSIEEIPWSFRSWSCLEDLHMQYCENLAEFPHAFECIRELHMPRFRVVFSMPATISFSPNKVDGHLEEIPGHEVFQATMVLGCTNLVSLPKLPDSLKILIAENCESLEKLDCSFHKTEFDHLGFINCFKLNQEARDFIIKTSTRVSAILPGEKVPTYFTHRTTGSFLSVNLNRSDTHFPISLRFKACVLIGKPLEDSINLRLNCRINGVKVKSNRSPLVKEHLLIFETETE